MLGIRARAIKRERKEHLGITRLEHKVAALEDYLGIEFVTTYEEEVDCEKYPPTKISFYRKRKQK